MALSDEKRAELEEAVTDMRLLDETVKTDGWQKILLPTYREMRAAAISKLLRDGNTVQDLHIAQAAVEMIDLIISDPTRNVESDLDRRIREGSEAVETLAKEKT